MVTLLWIIYVIDCILLIGIILLQPGEGGDLAAAFGASSSQTAFGARGSATFMHKVTTTLAVMFMVLSITLVIVTNRRQANIMERMTPEVTAAEEEAKKADEEPEAPGETAAQGEEAPGETEAPAGAPEGDAADEAPAAEVPVPEGNGEEAAEDAGDTPVPDSTES